MQALYQWQIGGHPPNEIYSQFCKHDEFDRADGVYFRELLFGTIDSHRRLLELIAPYLDRAPEHLDPMERSIVLIAAYELTHRDDVPYRVVINEAIELAKRFGAEGGHKSTLR